MISFSNPLKQLDGSDLKEGDKPVTLGKICVQALVAIYQDEPNLAGQEKFERWQLATKVDNSERGLTPITLTAAEADKLKLLVGKAYAPLIVGQVWQILNSTLVKL